MVTTFVFSTAMKMDLFSSLKVSNIFVRKRNFDNDG